MVNFTHSNPEAQELIGVKHNGVSMLVRLLRSGAYEPKKTACFCLGNLLKEHDINRNKAIKEGAVTLLTELINDEEDDELSKKAYECLEMMGE
jgi:hypothetical protein